MSLEDLTADVETAYDELGDGVGVDLDRETRNELAVLRAALGTDEDELIRRAVHTLFQTVVETGTMDFHLRNGYDLTYDEYLSGMTYEEMGGSFPQQGTNEDRRYQF